MVAQLISLPRVISSSTARSTAGGMRKIEYDRLLFEVFDPEPKSITPGRVRNTRLTLSGEQAHRLAMSSTV
jgi:hypothetical protein